MSEVNSLLRQGDKKRDELGSQAEPHSEKIKFNPGLNHNQQIQMQALSECHQKGLQLEKAQGLCLMNADQFGLFACTDIKKTKEKQFLECQGIYHSPLKMRTT